MKEKKHIYTLSQGGPYGTYWYVRRDGELIAGFIEQGHAEMFLKLIDK